MTQDSSSAAPGSPEFAAEVKQLFSERFARMKHGLRGGDDLVTLLFGCAYDNKQGYCFGCDGEPEDLINIMAITVIELSDRAWEKVSDKEKFLPENAKTPYRKVVVNVTQDLLFAIRGMTHDKKIDKPSSIIVPEAPM